MTPSDESTFRNISIQTVRRVWAIVSAEPQLTLQEIAERIDRSWSVANVALRMLKAAGYIDWPAGTTRARTVLVPFIITGEVS